jgi:hypothetical protein
MSEGLTHHEAMIDGVRVVAVQKTVPTLSGGSREAWLVQANGKEIATLPYSIHTTKAMLEEAMRTVLRMQRFTKDPD